MATQPVFHGDIENASADFLKFKREFFDDPWTAIKGEYDREALKRLAGPERELAAELIEENLATGPQFAHAALDLGLTRCIPRLVEIFERGKGQIELGFVLRKMGAISSERARDVWMGLVEQDEKLIEYLLPYCCEVLGVVHAAEFVRRGVASEDYGVRGYAYLALLELEDVIAGGGRYTEEVAKANNRRSQEIFKFDEAAERWRDDIGGPDGEPGRIAALVDRAERAVDAARKAESFSSKASLDAESPN